MYIYGWCSLFTKRNPYFTLLNNGGPSFRLVNRSHNLFTPRNSQSPLRIYEERSFLSMNRLMLTQTSGTACWAITFWVWMTHRVCDIGTKLINRIWKQCHVNKEEVQAETRPVCLKKMAKGSVGVSKNVRHCAINQRLPGICSCASHEIINFTSFSGSFRVWKFVLHYCY